MNRTNLGMDHVHPVYAILFVLVSGLALLLVLYLRFCHRRESEYVKKGPRGITMKRVSSEQELLFKILGLRDSGVGKSSLLRRYVDDKYEDTYISTSTIGGGSQDKDDLPRWRRYDQDAALGYIGGTIQVKAHTGTAVYGRDHTGKGSYR